jgi:hypothetical protein
MTTYRWITYVSDPQVVDSKLDRARDLDAAKDAFRDHVRTVGTQAAVMTVYGYDEEAWADAREFETSGCPFDSPAYRLSIGQFGALIIMHN